MSSIPWWQLAVAGWLVLVVLFVLLARAAERAEKKDRMRLRQQRLRERYGERGYKL